MPHALAYALLMDLAARHGAVAMITLYVAFLAAQIGWIIGARLGDEQGIGGWVSGALVVAAGTFWLFAI